jgi:Zn-dependent M16 (insulinase) family peptidase
MQPPGLCALLIAAGATASAATFDSLSEGAAISGFRTVAVYLDAADRPFGARFRHIKTGYRLDLVHLQSVPQAFTYANTYPTSDKGEPHTQEHLLVGKGNKGRTLAESEGMTLTEFTAFTMQWRTCYPINTQAGAPVFYEEFERLLDALIHPDYSDEEIRREVRNFGVTGDPATNKLHLEEKGSVYNEMVSTSRQQFYVLFKAFSRTVYGPAHPLSFESGGTPQGIREMLPADIRKFHREHYFLGNMGSVISLPRGEAVDRTLAQLDQILDRVQPQPVNYPIQTEATLPPPKPAPAGDIAIYDYPSQNEKQPGVIALAWPPDRTLNPRDEILFNLFMDNVAGGATSNLYRLFINSKTRKFDLGAAGVFNSVSSDQGHPAMIAIRDVAVTNLTQEKTTEVRQAILDEVRRIAALPDGSPELREFNTRVQNLITESRRQLSKIANSPPGFGFRSGRAFWMEHLDVLNKEPGFRKSLTMNADYADIEKMIAGEAKNIWKQQVQAWRLLDVMPFGIVTRPNAALLKTESEERQARASAETQRLVNEYQIPAGPDAEQDALQRYKKEYDEKSAELDKLANQPSHLKFIDKPPLTLDDQLDYKVTQLNGGVPMVASTFDNMTSATTALALRLDGVPESDLFLLTLLPSLMSQTGVIIDGKAVSYEEMQEMLRKEILGVSASLTAEISSGRTELVVQGSGNDLAESRRAIEWMRLLLLHPNWTAANLPRIRDLVEQRLAGLRSAMQGSEESWVRSPIMAYRKQTDPLYLTAASFLTGAHNADRVRWMLKGSGTAEDRASISSFLAKCAEGFGISGLNGAQLKPVLTAIESGNSEHLAGLTPRARELAVDVAKDLDQMLPDLPDASLPKDVSYLCNRIRQDLAVTPEKTLEQFEALRASLLKTGNARLWLVGSSANQKELQPQIEMLIGGLQSAPRNVVAYSNTRRIDARLREHQPDAVAPRFVGLFNPNMQGAVFNTLAPFTSYRTTDRESLLRYLTLNLFGGGGAQSVFTKTIGAGLAYSNGIAGSLREGNATYYAERMPDVTQTLHFVIDVIKKGPRDPRLTEYVMAGAFRATNAASSYEARARAIADDLADGVTPEIIKHFRESILALRKEPNLAEELFKRVDTVYGPVLPGYGPKAKDVPGEVYYLIGNDKQFKSLDADVQSREDERVYKLYPRDYWLM